jgi:hypothetical protein
MKRLGEVANTAAIWLALVAAAGVLSLMSAPRADAADADAKKAEEARLVVEASSLTKEAKSGLLEKFDHAIAAGFPVEDVAVIVARGLKQGVPGERLEGFLDALAAVKEQGLPARLVIERIELGLAKGVPAERIEAATRKLASHLAAAGPLVEKLGGGGPGSERGAAADHTVETVARALERSISPDAVMRTGEKVRGRKGSAMLFDRSLDTMTIFVGNGMNSDQAARLVHAALDRGYSERDLEAMERYMTEGLRDKHSMNDVVSGMESRMDRGTMRDMHERQGGGMMRAPGADGMRGGGAGMQDRGGMMR